MWPYFLLVCLIFILQFKCVMLYKEDIYFYIGVIALFLFAAFRGNGNGDYFVYLSRGADIDTIYEIFHNHASMEIGYCALYYLVNLLRLPAQCVIMAMNLISILCITRLIQKYSPYKCLSLLLFLPLYFQFDMHAARTAVAISISALSVTYAYRRRFLKFFLTVFLASLFHQTAWAALIIYFLVNIQIELFFSIGCILSGIGIVSFIGVDQIILKVFKVLNLNVFYNRFYSYANSERFGYSFSFLDPRFFVVVFVFIMAKLFCKKADKLENLFINCSFANVMAMVLLSEHTFICYRISAFFNVYSIILIPLLLDRFCNEKYYESRITLRNNSILAKSAVVFLFTAYALAHVYIGYVVSGIEYRFFF